MSPSAGMGGQAVIHSIQSAPLGTGFRVCVDFEAATAPGERLLVVLEVYDRKGDRLAEATTERYPREQPLRETCELWIEGAALRQHLPAGQHYVTYSVALITQAADGRRAELARSPFRIWSVSFRQ